MIEEDLLRELLRTCRLALRAAYHACDHPPQVVTKTAKRGCGACRAVVALEAVIPRVEAALQGREIPPASGPPRPAVGERASGWSSSLGWRGEGSCGSWVVERELVL